MKFEAEVIAREFLPAARSLLARGLEEDYGLYQREIAEIMDVTQPAVSQYLNEKRADPGLIELLEDDPQIMLLIDEAVKKAAKEENYAEELRQVLEAVKAKGLLEEEFRDAEKL